MSTLSQFFFALLGLTVALVLIARSIERGARLKDEKVAPRDPVIGIDQYGPIRKAALPFQQIAKRGPGGFDAQRPFLHEKDRDGQRRRELRAVVDLPSDKKAVN